MSKQEYEQHVCGRKIAYTDSQVALKAARDTRHGNHDGRWLDVYRCPIVARHFHVGHAYTN